MRNILFMAFVLVTVLSCNNTLNTESKVPPLQETYEVGKSNENLTESKKGCEAPWCTPGFTIYTENGRAWFEVAQDDYPTVKENMENAELACEQLGDGWRLPNEVEINEMNTQLFQKGKGNFKTGVLYRTSKFTKKLFPFVQQDGSVVNIHKVYCFEFIPDRQFNFGVDVFDGPFYFRPVRSL